MGPVKLVRLVQFSGYGMEGNLLTPSQRAGAFWFEESLFLELLRLAEADLKTQGKLDRGNRSVYAKLVLRDLLAIRKDWSENFDAYVTMRIPAGKEIHATVGTVRSQPVYSTGKPGHEAATRSGVILAGNVSQVVIDFSDPSNAKARSWIEGPFPL